MCHKEYVETLELDTQHEVKMDSMISQSHGDDAPTMTSRNFAQRWSMSAVIFCSRVCLSEKVALDLGYEGGPVHVRYYRGSTQTSLVATAIVFNCL
ncbi:hypothetical protein TNCV_605461 [Trichonephila clavipes]|nr:hypothetical protein TNCV_605461 [Trichonephila clavipes]